MRLLPVLLGLSGCQLVFELTPSDAPPDTDGSPDTGATADEDDDQIPDDADNCPGISNASQLSSDQDPVGDACDPYIGLVGDRVFARFMFATGFGDVNPGGTLQVVDGAVETSSNVDEVDATLTYVAPAPLAPEGVERFGLTAEVGFEVLELGSGNSLQLKVSTANSSVDCNLSDDDPEDPLSTAIFSSTDDVQALSGELSIRPNTLQRLVVGAHEERGAFCTFDGGSAIGMGTARGVVTVRLAIQRMHVRITYLAIYDNTSAASDK